ncbi:hypothetical protein WJX73_004063 [Symbiochloris irregularis]|uniref:t-SNARE coiled-coil homology domain-containing protein n=1 Tax=Symbiochloris irregularis TaxID=706552 RepID=A0AAW1NVZ2_9CHLO
MNISELVSRTNVIQKKYEKYTIIKDTTKLEKAADAFSALQLELIDRVNDLSLKAEEISQEKNRATKAVLNAEQRKAKANLLEVELPKLEKLVRKGKTTPEIIADREKKVVQVREAINGVADGIHAARKPGQIGAGPTRLGRGQKGPAINIDVTSVSDHRRDNADFYSHTHETRAFQAENEAAAKRTDKALDEVEKGIGTLKGIGEAIGETLKNQEGLLDAMEDKVDDAIKDLKTNNMKLKGLVTKMGSGRNFCIDIVLLCIVLAIALYIYNAVKTKSLPGTTG